MVRAARPPAAVCPPSTLGALTRNTCTSLPRIGSSSMAAAKAGEAFTPPANRPSTSARHRADRTAPAAPAPAGPPCAAHAPGRCEWRYPAPAAGFLRMSVSYLCRPFLQLIHPPVVIGFHGTLRLAEHLGDLPEGHILVKFQENDGSASVIQPPQLLPQPEGVCPPLLTVLSRERVPRLPHSPCGGRRRRKDSAVLVSIR